MDAPSGADDGVSIAMFIVDRLVQKTALSRDR
jgi:hypothetical protein